jgi:hypothetical protein
MRDSAVGRPSSSRFRDVARVNHRIGRVSTHLRPERKPPLRVGSAVRRVSRNASVRSRSCSPLPSYTVRVKVRGAPHSASHSAPVLPTITS